jgi:hypothetical protein
MQQIQDQQKNSQVTFLGTLAFVSRTLATSVEVFLHRGFGERYFGLHSAAVIPAVLVATTIWPGHDPTPLLVFLGAYLTACMAGKAGIAHRRKIGLLEHSYYNGRPFFLKWRLFRNVKERSAKGFEPFLVFFLGAFVMPLSEPLGAYLMVAALGLLVSLGMAETYERTRQLDMRDALIDQQNAAQRLRDDGWRR